MKRSAIPEALRPIRLDAGVEIDLAEAQDTKELIACNSGAGKSYALRSQIEQVCEQVQSFVLDKEGEFKTLRERHDFVLVGPDGELAADPRTARALAAALAKAGTNAILDVSDLEPDAQCRFVAEFLDGLFYLPKGEWRSRFVFLDEVQEFAPQTDVSEAQAVSLRAVVRIAAMGRKRGLCLVAASQRIAKVSKNVTAECNNRLIGRFAEDTDLKRAADLLGIGKGRWRELQSLKPGCFYAYGPAFNFDGVQLVRSGEVRTTHPKRGMRHLLKTPAPSAAIADVVEKLQRLQAAAATEAAVERAGVLHKDQELARLRAALDESNADVARLEATLEEREGEIGRLHEELEQGGADSDKLLRAHGEGFEQGFTELVDVRNAALERAFSLGLTAAARLGREKVEDWIRGLSDTISCQGAELLGGFFTGPRESFTTPDWGQLWEESTSATGAQSRKAVLDELVGALAGDAAPQPARTPKNGRPPPRPRPSAPVSVDGDAYDRVLVALLQHAGPVPRKRVALLAHLQLGGSTWRRVLARLRKEKFVGEVGEDMSATLAARNAYVGKVPPLPTGRELLAHWIGYLGQDASARMLAAIARGRGSVVSKQVVAGETGIELGGSTWRRGMATMRKLGVIVDRGKDAMALSPHML